MITTKSPSQEKRDGWPIPKSPQQKCYCWQCHPVALPCQPPCHCAPALHRAVFSRRICPGHPQTKKKPRAASRCDLSTLIVCSLLETTRVAIRASLPTATRPQDEKHKASASFASKRLCFCQVYILHGASPCLRRSMLF